jgi:hypothetical protein
MRAYAPEGFWIGGIALGLRSQFGEVGSLYPFLKQTEYLKSKIRIPNSKIDKGIIIGRAEFAKR